MSRRVVFSPEAEEQPTDLYHYIAAAVSPETAARYTEAIISDCEDLRMFPRRGTVRGDIRPELRDILHDDVASDGDIMENNVHRRWFFVWSEEGMTCEVSSRVHAL